MGGGFGSKFGADIWGRTAAQLSKKAGGRPVKMFLDRVQEHLAAGNRPSGWAHIKMGANRDGKIVAMIAEAHGTGGVGGGADVILPYVYSVPNTPVTQSTVFTNFGSAAGHAGPAASSELRADRSGHGRPGRQAGNRPARVPAQEPAARRFPHADLRGRGQDGGRADRLAREAQAARPDRNRPDPPRAGHGPAPVGRRRHPGQEGLLHDQPRRLGRASGARPRTSAPAPGRSWRSSPPRSSASSRPTSSRISATRPSRPARLRAARPPRPRWPRRATTRSPRHATRSSRRSRRPSRPPPADLVAQGRPALGLGRAGDVVERRLPQAGDRHDLRDRLATRRGSRASASAAASSPRSPSTSRPAWSRSRRSSPSRTRA